MPAPTNALAGQDTLLSCWRALAHTPFGPGQLVATPDAIVAIFPRSAYFNNAILIGAAESAEAAAATVARIYATAGIESWALWVPGTAAAFDGATDQLAAVGSLTRDVTTLAMHLDVQGQLRRDERVRPISSTAMVRLTLDEAVSGHELGDVGPATPIQGWALVEQGQAVASAYTHRAGSDLGIYAVSTLPAWRRRGLARILVEHILADTQGTGVRTASLQTTPMGQSVYAALGFRAVGRYEEWLHSPGTRRGGGQAGASARPALGPPQN
jgi:GNAT superfamily N-acetyltransferase